MKLPLIRQSHWNRLLDHVQRSRSEVTGFDRNGAPRQPWNVIARWNFQRGRFEFNLRAGYVNASPVLAPPMDWVEAPFATIQRVGESVARASGVVEPRLSERPWIPIDEKTAIPTNMTSTPLDVQAFFEQFPLVPGTELWRENPGLRRQLRAFHFVLFIPRPSAQTVVAEDRLSLAANIQGPAEGGIRIFPASVYDPRLTAPPLVEQLASGVVDNNFEIRKVATVYLLSPAGDIDPESKLTPAWQIFPAHDFFWNKAFAVKVSPRLFQPLQLSFPQPLAGGAGQAQINAILDDINQQDAEATLAFVKAGVEFSMWDV